MKLQSFRVTVSVKGDLSKEAETKILTYLRKKTLYAFVVAEHGGSAKRHLHAAVVMKEAMEGNDLVGYIWKLVQPVHPDSIRKYAVKKNAMVNHDWYDEYLRKETGVEVLYDKYDRDAVAGFFPTDAEQQLLMDHVVADTNDKPADPYFDRLEKEWTEYDPHESDYESAARFLNYIMFVARTERCISDTRRFNQIAWTLYKYRNKRLDVDVDTKNYGNQMTGNCC